MSCKNFAFSLFSIVFFSIGSFAHESADFCDSSRNIVSNTIIGTWQIDLEFTKTLLPTFGQDPEDNMSELGQISFIQDHSDSMRNLFKDLKTINKCAYIMGQIGFPLVKNPSGEIKNSYFAIIEMDGNPALAVTDNGDGFKARPIMLITGQDSMSDRLFFLTRNRGMVAYKRIQ